MIKPCYAFADIGCDHGIIAYYVVKNGLAKKVYACDISEKSLEKARALISDKDAEFLVGDGFSPLKERGICVDEAVIAGMGGEMIIKILSACADRPRLVLGAQKNTDKLRRFLVSHGYFIENDVKVLDGGIFYDIIRAVPGQSDMPDETQAQMGMYYKTPNADLAAYCDHLMEKLKKFKQTDKNKMLADCISEVKKWQR